MRKNESEDFNKPFASSFSSFLPMFSLDLKSPPNYTREQRVYNMGGWEQKDFIITGWKFRIAN